MLEDGDILNREWGRCVEREWSRKECDKSVNMRTCDLNHGDILHHHPRPSIAYVISSQVLQQALGSQSRLIQVSGEGVSRHMCAGRMWRGTDAMI